MSFETMEGQRRETADAILAKVGATIEKAELNAAAKSSDPAIRKLMGARMALEYAVLATAREKGVPTEVAATTLKGATVAQKASLLKDGAAALGRAYRVEPEVLVNVFAGRLTEVNMPKDLGSTPEIDKMIDTCRGLVTSIVKDEYATRGRFDGRSSKPDSFLALKSESVVAPHRSELATRLAFLESTIDAATGKGAISQANADMLKERIEASVFQPRLPQSLEFSPQFKSYFEQRGKAIRIEAMTEVRGVTQSQTVQQIADKLKMLMPAGTGRADLPSDHRAHKPMER